VTDGSIQRRAVINGVVAGLVTLVIGFAVVVAASGDDLPLPTGTPTDGPSPTPPACEASWQTVQAADPGDAPNALNGVVALAPTEAWSVGASGDPTAPAQVLIERWDGNAWTAEQAPSPGSETNELLAVDASGRGDVWAVGRTASGFGDRPLALRFDGVQWQEEELPEEITGRLTGVAVISPDDVWVVGFSGSADSLTERTLLLHWDGALWAVVDAGGADGVGRSALLDVDALATDDVWAAGFLHNRPLLIHFDGEAWSRMESGGRGAVHAVEPLTADDAWAVGADVLRFDGAEWSVPPNLRPGGELSAVAAVSAQDVWAVGSVVAENGVSRALVLRFDGQRWTPLPGPRVPGSETLTGVDALPDGTVVAVGYRDVESGRRTFAIRGATCPGIA
jgi:hypothetical protein